MTDFASMVRFHLARMLKANQYKVLLIILITFYLVVLSSMTLPPAHPILKPLGLTK